MDGLAPATASRVRALLWQWLTRRINRGAGTTVVMGMMVSDVAEQIQHDIENFLDRVHRAAVVAPLDEMDLDRLP